MNLRAYRRWLAELAGTALLVAIGTGAIVAGARGGGIPQWLLALAWFFAVLVPIILCIRTSGAQLNPAVTLALAASGRIAWRELPWYWASQTLGAFLGSTVVLVVLGRSHQLGSTVPVHGGAVAAFGLEATFTGLLVGAVFALSDRGEGRWRWRLLLPPAAVGLSTNLIGPWTGSSLNPARSLAPAVLSGTYTDLWVYLTSAPLAALAIAAAWRPRSVDLSDRGPGRRTVTR